MTVTITPNEAGQRLDRYLRKKYFGQTLGEIYKLIRKGQVKVNGKKAKPEYRLEDGDLVTMPDLKQEKKEAFVNIPADFEIVFEDDNLIVVNKPAGLLVHPDKTEMKKTLINQVLAYLYRKGEYDPQSQSTFAPALCHRLDRNTSGLVIIAKNYPALQTMTELIRKKRVKKFYLCLVEGRLSKPGSIELKLEKNEKKNQVKVSKRGLTAITRYLPIENISDYSLLEVEIVTGRTHQIRVHFSSIGHPLVGDLKYGKRVNNERFRKEFGLKRQFLHAYKLVIESENTSLDYLDGRHFRSDLPKDLELTLSRLEASK
ncbi:MAG: RluA family pseudouridine synthase [Firmicutes bacterium]|nr:RluA family pseudouridine synthase [Bacillota bacterium]